jgi:hypothetical protein
MVKLRFTPHLADLTFDAALRSFWRKNALTKFLRSLGLKKLPAFGPDEVKRDYLERVFAQLQESDAGKVMILKLAHSLAEQASFPDLAGWENSSDLLAAAMRSVSALQSYIREQSEASAAEERGREAREKFREAQASARASQQTLQTLAARLTDLSAELGSPEAGRSFEAWFYDLMQFSEITSRRRYISDGREIDGSITLGDTTYLVECKFTSEQSQAPDIDVFRAKVGTKADNTMGIFVSISGFSSVAIRAASGNRTPVLLLDYSHIYTVLGGSMSFRDVVERVRRHASQTGEAYLPVNKFSG